MTNWPHHRVSNGRDFTVWVAIGPALNEESFALKFGVDEVAGDTTCKVKFSRTVCLIQKGTHRDDCWRLIGKI
jgi:hypothetical protein